MPKILPPKDHRHGHNGLGFIIFTGLYRIHFVYLVKRGNQDGLAAFDHLTAQPFSKWNAFTGMRFPRSNM